MPLPVPSCIHQTADIVLPDPDDARSGYPDGCNWDPVERFTGSYDGGGYKISHLVINSVELLSAGLFGNVGEDAELKNINLTEVNIVTWSSGYVGALAAYNEGTIENCSVSGIISCPGYSVVGGIAGSNSGMIKNCSTSGIIEGGEYCTVSGISGHNGGTIENCSASGVITGGEFCIVGGINGYNLGTITACTTNGNFSGFSNCEIGGITGSNAGVIADSTAYCCLPDRSDSNIGGIVGSNHEEFGGTITNCTDNTSRASAETLYFVMNEEEGKFYIVMLMRAYGIEPDVDPDPKDNFADAGNAYYTGYLAAAKRLGISNGTGNNMYSPLKEITRQEMFTLLYNALKVTGQLPAGDSGNKLSDFSDADKIASWAYEAMKLLVETGMISGSGGKLAPTATTTRAEMAQVLYNLLNR